MKRPPVIAVALALLSASCGELSARRRKWNFLNGTIVRLDGEDADMCDAISAIVEYLDEVETENVELRQSLARALGDEVEHEGGVIAEMAERRGECAAELAGKPLSELRGMAGDLGLPFDEDAAKSEASLLAADKAEGHECSVCEHAAANA